MDGDQGVSATRATRRARVTRLSMAAPDDVAPIRKAIDAGGIDPGAIRAVFGKTEGNGCVNDFTRAFAVQSLRALLSAHLCAEALERVAFVMSGGTEGALSPHWLVIEALEDAPADAQPSLAVGVHVTEPLPPEGIGRMAQVDQVANGVRVAMEEAGIGQPSDVHFVQIKCPLVTVERAAEAAARNQSVRTADTLKSMGLSRGASALGVAVALGELDGAQLSQEAIGADRALFSRKASASAGIELMGHEIVVFGQSAAWSGPMMIASAVMADAIDLYPVRAMLEAHGLAPGAEGRLVALLAKAEPSSNGRLRGYRHTMLDDSDIAATRHARGFVAGALAGLVGHAEIFVSGGAEHQGPDGGGPVAALFTTEPQVAP